MNKRTKENNMYDDFPVGGEPLDIPDVGHGTRTDVEVLLEA